VSEQDPSDGFVAVGRSSSRGSTAHKQKKQTHDGRYQQQTGYRTVRNSNYASDGLHEVTAYPTSGIPMVPHCHAPGLANGARSVGRAPNKGRGYDRAVVKVGSIDDPVWLEPLPVDPRPTTKSKRPRWLFAPSCCHRMVVVLGQPRIR
jgi:hypothetical protein